MERVGLITCYADNYGACLQAYALQQIIKGLGHDCEIIKYTPIRALRERQGLAKLIVPLLDVLRGIKNRHSIYAHQGGMRTKFRDFKRENLIFGRESYPTIDSLYKSPPDYDVFVTGSDQLWNPIIHGMRNNRAHFLDFVPSGKRRVAYAPSIGVSRIPEHTKKEMAQLLEKMDVVSVREEAGKAVIGEISDKRCRVVLDPTLLLGPEDWKNVVVEYPHEKPYIFCYVFSERDYVSRFIEYAKEETGFDVVVIPYTQREMEKGYIIENNAGPKEFLGMINNASLVITDSFHATAFSINFNRPFFSLLRNEETEMNNMNSRITNILRVTSLEQRLIASEADFPELQLDDIDYSLVNESIIARRASDKQFLLDSLNSSK